LHNYFLVRFFHRFRCKDTTCEQCGARKNRQTSAFSRWTSAFGR